MWVYCLYVYTLRWRYGASGGTSVSPKTCSDRLKSGMMTAELVLVLVDRSGMSVNLYVYRLIDAMDCADMYSYPIAYGLSKYNKLYDLRTWLVTGLHMHTKSLSFMEPEPLSEAASTVILACLTTFWATCVGSDMDSGRHQSDFSGASPILVWTCQSTGPIGGKFMLLFRLYVPQLQPASLSLYS